MTASFSVLLLLFATVAAGSGVQETEDSVITTAVLDSLYELNSWETFYGPAGITRQYPYGRSCLTFDDKQGVCRSMQECYPYTKLHQTLGSMETWVIGTRGTCHYVEPTGQQVYGVCCHSEEKSQPSSDRQPTRSHVEISDQPSVVSNIAGTRIVSGTSSSPGEYPFMVGILNRGKIFCGGSLLDSTTVLTAAHCIDRMSATDIGRLIVVMGTTDLNDPDRILRRVQKVARHKSFDGAKLYNDIALLTLHTPVAYSSTVAPVCLETDSSANYDGEDAVVIGWGRLSENGPSANTLQKATLQIKTLDDCRTNFGSKAPGGIVDHYICASSPGKDSCGGDSGGPLMLDRGGSLCQIGIVSWGIGCATKTYGVYTRIASFQDWVIRNRALASFTNFN